MIRSILAAIWSLSRPHRHFIVNFLLPVSLALVTCIAIAGWRSERDERARNAREHQKTLRLAERWEILYHGAAKAQARDDVLVSVTRDRWRVLRDTIWEQLERVHSDAPSLLPKLPEFLRATDSAIAACSSYQTSCEARGRIADSLLAAKARIIAELEHRPAWAPPRWTAEAEVLYDPLGVAPAAGGALTLRLFGGASAVVRAEQRFAPDERPRIYIGVRRSF